MNNGFPPSVSISAIKPAPSAPVFRPGPLLGRSIAAAGVGAGPDEGVALAVFVIEEVGVDRGGKARIVQLQARVFVASMATLSPEAATGAPRSRGLTAQEELSCRARNGGSVDQTLERYCAAQHLLVSVTGGIDGIVNRN